MIKCPLCSKKIKKQNLYNYFKITLGNFINGVFTGEKILYFHVECLRITERCKSSLLTP